MKQDYIKHILLKVSVVLLLLQVFRIMPAYAATSKIQRNNPITTVMLRFVDNTQYSKINTAKMASELLLTELFDCQYLALVERYPVEEALNAEDRMNVTEEKKWEAVDNQDFEYLFQMKENDMNKKGRGDFVPKEVTKVIGEKYHAEYLVHGTIEFLGTGIATDETLKYFTGISRTTPYLTAGIAVRLIHANTGEVVWAKRIRGISKDSYFEYKGIGGGTKELNSQLFHKAVQKACEITRRELTADFEKGLIKLTQ